MWRYVRTLAWRGRRYNIYRHDKTNAVTWQRLYGDTGSGF